MSHFAPFSACLLSLCLGSMALAVQAQQAPSADMWPRMWRQPRLPPATIWAT